MTSRGRAREEPFIKFKWKYLEQALFVNHHFLVLILVGLVSLIFPPLATSFAWVNQNIEFINSLMLGVGVSGVFCWCFAFKIRGDVSRIVWTVCHALLNICHILSVAFFLFFFCAVGIKSDGSVSSLACGVFSSSILGIMLSMKYTFRFN